MPATYSHRHTYEQITGRGRNTRKRPEPSEPKEYRIFGYEVDAATYRKFNRQDYRVGFGFHGLLVVELWATDPYYKKQYPEKAAEAKAIMDEIITQITGKEQKKMKEPRTASEFIQALQDIYTESRAAYVAMHEKVDRAKKKVEKAQENAGDTMGKARYDIALAESRIAEDELRTAYRNLIAEHNAKVQELREQFTVYLDERYSASPDRLDAATMQLLNAGICTPSELAKLVDRHADNPTMLRIIGNYARNMREEKHNVLSSDDQRICTVVTQAANAAKDGSRELAIYDSAASSLVHGLGENPHVAERLHSRVDGWMDDFKNQITNLPVTPAETGDGGE